MLRGRRNGETPMQRLGNHSVPSLLADAAQAPLPAIGCTAKIRSLHRSLPPAERRVADFVLRDPERTLWMTARDLAKGCDTSEATVVRFCQSLGYQGLPEFRTALIQEVFSSSRSIYQEVTDQDSPTELIRKVVNLSINALQDTIAVLDPQEFDRAVQALVNAQRLHFFGAGGSSYIAQEATLKFLRLSMPAVAFIDYFSQINSAALLGEHDVAIGLSYTGATESVVQALGTARQAGATTICITNFDRSPITEVADIKLLTGAFPALLGGEAGHSRVAQLCVIDALATAFALHKKSVAVNPNLPGS